jgi:magnesium transporter
MGLLAPTAEVWKADMCETGSQSMEDSPTPYETRVTCWDKGARHARAAGTIQEAEETHVAWIHVQAHNLSETAEFLKKTFGFHDLEIEDALTAGERPHLEEAENHLFFTAPAIRVEDGKLYFAEAGFFLSKGRLVTVATEPIAVLDEWIGRCAKPVFGSMPEASRLVYHLLDALIDDYYPAMDQLEDQAEALEDLVFAGRPVGVKDLLRLKRRLLETRRRLGPLRDILNGLLRHDQPLIARADRIYFQDVYDHVLRVLEHVDLNRDLLASILDANLATVSNRLNQIMRVLTVASVVLMSMALIAGIYGMNFKFMPELGWPNGYPLSLASMAAVGLVELWIFRKMGWL